VAPLYLAPRNPAPLHPKCGSSRIDRVTALIVSIP
jgi:hypothetical protein